MSNSSLERLFQTLAVVLLGLAAFFLWQGNYEGIFVASVLSSVSYFLSFRFQVRERLDRREAERAARELEEIELNRGLLRESGGAFGTDDARTADRKEEEFPANG